MRKVDARGGKTKAGRPTIGSSHAVTGRKPAAGKPRPKAKPKPPARPPARPSAPAKTAQKPKRTPTQGPRRIVDTSARPSEEAKHLAVLIATAALDKKAVNVQIFDVVGRVDYADFLVLMSGRSDRHVVSIADGIEEHLSKETPKRKASAIEGRELANWIVLDFGDVVAHVFQEEARAFYDLDALWQDARRVPVANA
jgi:ribosome-associated protein